MKKKIKLFAFTAVACVAFLAACVFLDEFSVDQPQPDGTMAPRIQVGETATFTISGHLEVSGDRDDKDIFVFGMLAPRSWNIRYNVTPTFTATEVSDPLEVHTMSVIPSSSAPKNMPGYTWPEALMERFGLGTNRFNDMEWVAWQADDAIECFNGTKAKYELTVKCKVSDDNLICAIGFFVNDIADGLTTDDRYYKVVYSDPFTVYGGVGETIDYQKLRFNTVDPSRALQDDFITFTFAGDAYSNELVNCSEIYFEGVAYTAEGGRYEMKEHNTETLMTRETTFSQEYSTTIWPAGMFNIPDGETITNIRYRFAGQRVNDEGKVIYHYVDKKFDDAKSNGDEAVDTTDNPEENWFTFNLVCGQ